MGRKRKKSSRIEVAALDEVKRTRLVAADAMNECITSRRSPRSDLVYLAAASAARDAERALQRTRFKASQ